jgi:hypothetical protein
VLVFKLELSLAAQISYTESSFVDDWFWTIFKVVDWRSRTLLLLAKSYSLTRLIRSCCGLAKAFTFVLLKDAGTSGIRHASRIPTLLSLLILANIAVFKYCFGFVGLMLMMECCFECTFSYHMPNVDSMGSKGILNAM